MAKPKQWIAKERLYKTKSGNIVTAREATKLAAEERPLELIAAPGVALDWDVAKGYGLIADKAEAAPEEPDGEPTAESEDDLDGLTVAQLKERAEELGVDLAGASKKAEIIEALRSAK